MMDWLPFGMVCKGRHRLPIPFSSDRRGTYQSCEFALASAEKKNIPLKLQVVCESGIDLRYQHAMTSKG
ncbi:MAG: hypothetical protein H7843_08685 [Nitrospirota bacterium]